MGDQFICDHGTEHRLVSWCVALGVSRRGYYAWRSRPGSARTQGNRMLADRIRQFHAQTKERYGAVKLWQAVRGAGLRCGTSSIHPGGESDLGRGSDGDCQPRVLAVPGRDPRSALAAGHRQGHECQAGPAGRPPRPADGAATAMPSPRPDPSHGSRGAVHQCRVSTAGGPGRPHCKHESQGQLLRQRRRGKLLVSGDTHDAEFAVSCVYQGVPVILIKVLSLCHKPL